MLSECTEWTMILFYLSWMENVQIQDNLFNVHRRQEIYIKFARMYALLGLKHH